MGEADLVARDETHYVILEVKSRVREQGQATKSASASPFQSITQHKRRKLRSIATYLAKHNHWDIRQVRIEAVAVEFERGDNNTLKVIDCRMAKIG